jgi:shikimate kinase
MPEQGGAVLAQPAMIDMRGGETLDFRFLISPILNYINGRLFEMKIVLIGSRASGKSTIGRALAARLGGPYFDVDDGIEEREGDHLAGIYTSKGASYFRRVEADVAREVMQHDQCVVTFGAGTIMTPANRDLIDENTFVVYLRVPIEVLWDRIQADPDSATRRPPLRSGGRAEVEEILTVRGPVYEEVADLVVDGTGSPDELVIEIANAVARKKGA